MQLSNSPAIVIPGRKHSERTRNPYSAAPGLWIPGSRLRAPRNDKRGGARHRPYSLRRGVRRRPVFPFDKMPRGWSAGWRTSLPSCRTSYDVRAPAGAPSRRFFTLGPRFLGRGKWASPSPASSSQSGRNAARSGPRASRGRGYEPRPQAPHRPAVSHRPFAVRCRISGTAPHRGSIIGTSRDDASAEPGETKRARSMWRQ